MQLLILLAVLLCVSLAEVAPAEPAVDVVDGLLLNLGGMAVTIAVAAIISASCVRSLRVGQSRGAVLRNLGRRQTWHAVLWLIVAIGALHFGHWPQIVRYNWCLAHAILVDDLLILTPLVVSLLISWAALHAVDRELAAQDHTAILKCSGAAEAQSAHAVTTLQAIGLHARHYLALPIVPLLLMLGVEDAGRLLAPDAAENWSLGMLLPPLLLLALFFPVLLRYLWNTRPLAVGVLRERLENTARAWGVAPREILVWNTRGQIINAAVAGFVPRLRYVFLSDLLVQRFDAGEIEAVFAHELAHLRERHMLKRTLVLMLPVVLWIALREMMPAAIETGAQWLSAFGLSTSLQAAVLFPLAMGTYFVSVFAPYSRLLEHEADLAACCEPGKGHKLRPELVTQFATVLEKLAAGTGRRTRSLLHPTVAERVALLHGCLENPNAALSLRRRTALAQRLCGSLAAGSLAVVGLSAWPLPLAALLSR